MSHIRTPSKGTETSRSHARSRTENTRLRTGRRSPEVLFDSTPLYLPRNENVKTIEISINKCEDNKKTNRKTTKKRNSPEVHRRKSPTNGMSSHLTPPGPDNSREDSPQDGVMISAHGRRREKTGGQCQNPR